MKPTRKTASVSFLKEHLEKLDRLRGLKLETRGAFLGRLIENIKEPKGENRDM